MTKGVTLLFTLFLSFAAAAQSFANPQGAVLNTVILAYPGQGGQTGHTYLIASLPPPDGNDFDHVHVIATLGGWIGSSMSYLDATFSNRSFAYTWSLRGYGPLTSPGSKLVAYRDETDGSVDIFLVFGDGYFAGGYSILEAEQDTAYPYPGDNGGSTPSGTLVFDSSSPLYPPTSYTDFRGNLSVSGNLGIGTATPGSDLVSLPSPPAASTPVFEVGGVIALTQGGGGQFIYSDGTVQSTAWNGVLSGGDYAESVNVSGARNDYQPGDVLVIDPTSEGKFLKSSAPYSTGVTGIYSTKPGVVGRRQLTARARMKEEVPMAMTGIVPTKVSAENGPIKPGDLLVTSSKPGYAMKGTDRAQMLGAVIGKAIGHLDNGVGIIETVVTLQ